jgi:hypothetical protein
MSTKSEMRALLNLAEARTLAATLNEKLRPIAETPVDPNDPTWMDRMRQSSPLDQAGVRPEAEALLLSLLNAYASGTSQRRADIRDVFRKNSAFRWAATIRQSAATTEGFRLRLLRLSALNGIEDPRDLSLNLRSILEAAQSAGVAIEPIFKEVAVLSESPLREVLAGER